MSDTTQDGITLALEKARALVQMLESTLLEFHEHHDDGCHNGAEREDEDDVERVRAACRDCGVALEAQHEKGCRQYGYELVAIARSVHGAQEPWIDGAGAVRDLRDFATAFPAGLPVAELGRRLLALAQRLEAVERDVGIKEQVWMMGTRAIESIQTKQGERIGALEVTTREEFRQLDKMIDQDRKRLGALDERLDALRGEHESDYQRLNGRLDALEQITPRAASEWARLATFQEQITALAKSVRALEQITEPGETDE